MDFLSFVVNFKFVFKIFFVYVFNLFFDVFKFGIFGKIVIFVFGLVFGISFIV